MPGWHSKIKSGILWRFSPRREKIGSTYKRKKSKLSVKGELQNMSTKNLCCKQTKGYVEGSATKNPPFYAKQPAFNGKKHPFHVLSTVCSWVCPSLYKSTCFSGCSAKNIRAVFLDLLVNFPTVLWGCKVLNGYILVPRVRWLF